MSLLEWLQLATLASVSLTVVAGVITGIRAVNRTVREWVAAAEANRQTDMVEVQDKLNRLVDRLTDRITHQVGKKLDEAGNGKTEHK